MHNPLDTYLQEADDLLVEIEEVALNLSAGDCSAERVNQLFRAFHTIKGSGAMFGLEKVAGFTHHVETTLDQLRSGSLPGSEPLIALILAAKDHIKLLLASHQDAEIVDPADSDKLIAAVQEFSCEPGLSWQPAHTPAAAAQNVAECADLQIWDVCFKPHPGIFGLGGNPALLLRDLRNLGECEVHAHTEDIPALEEIEADACHVWWTIRLRSACDRNAIRDVFLFVEDDCELDIQESQSVAGQSPREPNPLPPATESSPSSVGLPIPKPLVEETRKAAVKESTVRVPSARLDRLVSLVGELVMNQSRMSQAAAKANAPELANPVQEIERLVAELRDDVLGIRMLPIGIIFGRFRRNRILPLGAIAPEVVRLCA